MEDIMNARALRELEPVCHFPHALQHLVRASVLGSKLSTPARREGLSRAVKKAKPHPVPHLELQPAMIGVVVLAGMLLGLQKASTNLGNKLIVIGEDRVHDISLGTTRSIRQQLWRSAAIHHDERRCAES